MVTATPVWSASVALVSPATAEVATDKASKPAVASANRRMGVPLWKCGTEASALNPAELCLSRGILGALTHPSDDRVNTSRAMFARAGVKGKDRHGRCKAPDAVRRTRDNETSRPERMAPSAARALPGRW